MIIVQPNSPDEFGPTLFKVKGIIEKIPRDRKSEYKHVEIKSLTLNNTNNNTYAVWPNHSPLYIDEKKANIAIRKYIWNTFFGLSSNYQYSDVSHYPTTFKIYLKRLTIDIPDIPTLDNFILMVRNVIFTRIIFLFRPPFIQTVNSLVKERQVRIHNDAMYDIKPLWKYWLK